MEKEIEGKASEQEKLYRAYLADAYTPDEFASEKKRITRECEVLLSELEQLKSQVLSPDEIEEKKQAILSLADHFRTADEIKVSGTIEAKQMLVRAFIDEILIDVNAGQFEVKGKIGAGVYNLEQVEGMSNHIHSSNLSYSLTYSLFEKAIKQAQVQFA